VGGKARKVEDLGYDVLLIPDHLADLRIGTAVLDNDFRLPSSSRARRRRWTC
jgi:hypothetical protein